VSDWQAGDLALCVRGGVKTRTGAIYCVKYVKLPREKTFEGGVWWINNCGDIELRFTGMTDVPGIWAGARRFVKITPGHKIEGSEVDQKQPWKVDA